jgi:eukaryotic-like serine/threonine-protein kinase
VGLSASRPWQAPVGSSDLAPPSGRYPTSDPELVQPQLRTAPTDLGSTATPVPADLLTDAVRRLRLACVVWMVLLTTVVIVNHLVLPWLHLRAGQVVPWPPVADVLAVVCILVSALVYRYAPIACKRAETLVDLGIGYEVVLAFAIGVINQWEPQVLAGRLSWICALVLLHPTIVPGPPRKILLGSLLAASMDPVGLWIAWLRGVDLPPLGALVWAYLPNYICAGLAVIPSHVLSRLSRQVSRAREMGSYQLGALIGQGGMGEVWHAHHRLLARPAAIKLIRTEFLFDDGETSSKLALQRLRREAEAAASLRSPHTIQLYDFGVTADGQFYLVMELLDGIDLESLVRRFGPQPARRVIHFLRQACHSLAEAHAIGLVHRDIKPANLHLCRLGLEYDFVKVLDFGLVKHDTRSASAQTLLSGPGMTSGTPAYMAPELVSGEPIDGRLDLYSLGCAGYFLLTGELVFEADSALRMIGQHLQAAPIPPSIRSGRAVPEALERLILACLAKEPDGRPATAAELARKLAAIDLVPWSPEEAQAWWEANLGAPVPASPVVFPARSTSRVEVAPGR